MSLPGPKRAPTHPIPAWVTQVTAGDLLLFLIVNLSALRLAGFFVGSILGAARGGREGGGEAMALAVPLSLILLQTLVLLACLRGLILRKYGVSWADLGLRPCPRVWYWRAFLLALVMLPVVGAFNAAIPRIFDVPFENPQISALAPSGFNWPALIGMTVMGGIVAPFAEELVFRGLLYGWLRGRMGFAAAAGLNALCFAVMHGVVLLIPALVAVGLALAWVTERSGSIWPAIVTHGVFNSAMILTLYAALAQSAGR